MRTLALKKSFVLVQFATLLTIATIAPLFSHQLITGAIVNATLFISTVFLGLQAGILISLVPSLIALSIGLLPMFLAPMIPFIILGNIILVFSFDYLKKNNYLTRIIVASFLKFFFLFSTSFVIINFFFQGKIASNVFLMMSWPQLITALTGGLIAYFFLKMKTF